MLFEADFSIGPELLVPHQTIAMRRKARDHIVQSIAIYVVGIHLRAALRKRELVECPYWIAVQRRWLFPPAVFLEQIHASVAVYVTYSHTVGELAVIVVGRDGVKSPRPGRFLPVGLGIAVIAF